MRILNNILKLIIISIFLFFPSYIHAETTNTSQVIIIDLGGLTIEEIIENPFNNLHNIINQGAIGLMNTSTAGTRNRENGYITMGAGTTNRWGNSGTLILNSNSKYNDEEAKKIYERLTGINITNEDGVILDFAQSLAKVQRHHSKSWAQLGKIAAENNKKTALISANLNNDMGLLFMDDQGKIPTLFTNMFLESPLGCIELPADYERIFSTYLNIKSEKNIIGIDLGDWQKLLNIKDMVLPQVYEQTKDEIIKLTDDFLGNMGSSIDTDNDLLILLSPSPTREQEKNRNLMVPVIMYGAGIEPGVLTSPSTRREGIITNLDILPTILKHLDLPLTSSLTGRPIITKSYQGNTLVKMADLNNKLKFIYNARPTLVQGYITLQIITLLAAIILIFTAPRYLLFLRIPLLFLMTVPVAFLFVGLVFTTNFLIYLLLIILICFLVVTAAVKLPRIYLIDKKQNSLNSFIIIGLITSMALLFDLYLGANLIKISTLGYDPLAGARYYGIGNEYVGVLIGATIIGISGLLENIKNNRYIFIICLLYLGLATYLIASPNLGSNLGGTVAACVGFSYLILTSFSNSPKFYQVALTGSISAVFLLALTFFDSLKDPEVQSHFGRTTTLVYMEGFEPLIEIINRKVGMNIKLFRYTIWSRVFLLGMSALVIVFFKPTNLIKKLKNDYPLIFQGLFAIVWGSVAALFANDSGIVAAATMLIYAVAPLLYLGGIIYLEEKVREEKTNLIRNMIE